MEPHDAFKRPGEVMRLPEDLGEIPAGLYVVMEVSWLITLSRLGENEDGDICTTARLFKITDDEFERLLPMHLRLALLGDNTPFSMD